MEMHIFLEHDCVQGYLSTDVSCIPGSPIRTVEPVHRDHLGLCLSLGKLLLIRRRELS